MLTNAAISRARPKDRAFKLPDTGGLYLWITPGGYRSWRLRFRDPATGKDQTLTIGASTELSLDQARARRDAARAQLARGEDPRTCAISKTANLAAAARAWHAHRASGWSPVHAADVLGSLERDAFPAIGDMALDAIGPADILDVLRAVERRGSIETARRLRQRLAAIYDFAREEGWTTAAPVGKGEALANAPASGCQAALIEVDELVALRVAVESLDALPVLKLASRFLALTAVRLAALRGMRWDEVEDLDGPEPIWRVPAARMKLKAAKKVDPKNDHLVPLSSAAVAVLRAARAIGGTTTADGLVFPGRRGGDAPIGEGAIGELYGRTDFDGRHVPHGWRSSFSTVMNERRPHDRAAIDQALGHKPKTKGEGVGKSEGAYNRATYLPLRRVILEEWGALIAPGPVGSHTA